MVCQECGNRPATLHFTKIVNGEKTEFHICEHCAREKGDFLPGTNQMDFPFITYCQGCWILRRRTQVHPFWAKYRHKLPNVKNVA